MKRITTFLSRLLENIGLLGCGLLLLGAYVIVVVLLGTFDIDIRNFYILIAVASIVVALINVKAIISYLTEVWNKMGPFGIGLTLFGLYCIVASYSGIINKGMNGENTIGVVVGLIIIVVVASRI